MQHNVKLTALQARTVAAIIKNICNGEKSVLIQSMTGSGKTYMGFQAIVEYLAMNPKHKVQIVVPTTALVEQFHATAAAFGIKASVYHGTIKNRYDNYGRKIAMPYDAKARINITLPDTFAGLLRGENLYGFDMSWKPTLLLMDEAHKNTSASSQLFRLAYPEAFVLGFTATPRREQNGEGEHLMDWYGDNLIVAATPEELIAEGRIVPPQIHQFDSADNEVDRWFELTAGYSNKSTMAVCKDTDAAIAYVKAFRNRGVNAELITAVGSEDHNVQSQSVTQRQELQSKFKRGEITVLVSVDTLCEGFDAPRASFVMILRSMTSEALYHQVVGRVLRTFTCEETGEVKTHGTVLDFGGNHKRFGSILERVWTPVDYAPAGSFIKEKGAITASRFLKSKCLMIACERCQKVYDTKARKACNHCGKAHQVQCEVTTKDWLKAAYNLDSSVYAENKEQFQMLFISKGGSGFDGLRVIANSVFGTDVLRMGGGVNDGHDVLVSIMSNKRNLGDKLRIPVANISHDVLDRLAA